MGCKYTLSKHFLAAVVGAGWLSACLNTVYAQQSPALQAATTLPFVSPIFGDNMVLQRNKPDKIWGWSEPGDSIRVVIGNNTASAVAGADHRWQVEIQPPPAGGPYTVKITGRQSVELHNVLVGDVWLCAGQSNMEFKLRGALNATDEVKAANYSADSLFHGSGTCRLPPHRPGERYVECCLPRNGCTSLRGRLLLCAAGATGHTHSYRASCRCCRRHPGRDVDQRRGSSAGGRPGSSACRTSKSERRRRT